jgi:hypothetical protein
VAADAFDAVIADAYDAKDFFVAAYRLPFALSITWVGDNDMPHKKAHSMPLAGLLVDARKSVT